LVTHNRLNAHSTVDAEFNNFYAVDQIVLFFVVDSNFQRRLRSWNMH